MLQIKSVDEKSLKKVEKLYEESFPENERRALKELLDLGMPERDFVTFYDEDVFCGFASLLTWKDVTHILYFAVEKELRGKGYGSQALRLLETVRSGNRVIADLEADVAEAPNKKERDRRSSFYQHNGYHKSGIEYQWREEGYEIFIKGGSITEEEFWNFWKYFNGKIQRFSNDPEKHLQ